MTKGYEMICNEKTINFGRSSKEDTAMSDELQTNYLGSLIENLTNVVPPFTKIVIEDCETYICSGSAKIKTTEMNASEIESAIDFLSNYGHLIEFSED